MVSPSSKSRDKSPFISDESFNSGDESKFASLSELFDVEKEPLLLVSRSAKFSVSFVTPKILSRKSSTSSMSSSSRSTALYFLVLTVDLKTIGESLRNHSFFIYHLSAGDCCTDLSNIFYLCSNEHTNLVV